MAEQRNTYRGTPPRPWIRLSLVAADGGAREIDALADTVNPCALIVGLGVLAQFNSGRAPGMSNNFGPLDGGWLRLLIPELAFDESVLAYGSDVIVQAVQGSDPAFVALAGLPFLRVLNDGGDRDAFWLRAP